MNYKLQQLRSQKLHLLTSGLINELEMYKSTVAELKMIDVFEELLIETSERDEGDD